MTLSPDILRQNAAAMLAYADGKPIEVCDSGTWKPYQTSFHAGLHPGWNQWEFRPAPWKLPEPPAGRSWHRLDWREEMLPDGYRPLLLDEKTSEQDQYYCGGNQWEDGNTNPIARPATMHTRTTRPLPAEPRMVPWDSPEDVPGPVCWVKEGEEDEMPVLVVGFMRKGTDPHKGCCGVATSHNEHQYTHIRWERLALWQYSTDRKTWRPCTKEAK